MKHLTTLLEVTSQEVREILELSADLKKQTLAGHREPLCLQKVLTMVFEKPSLRTRVSFEAGMSQLGGRSLFLSSKEAGFEGRETKEDIAKVLGSYSDVIVLRTFSQELIDTFIEHANRPIINGLSDEYHPCQALTDVMTIEEFQGPMQGRKLVYVGDGNNMTRSLAFACGHVGASITVAAPKDYWLTDEFLTLARKEFPKLTIEQTDDPMAAVAGADVIYTDVWASMGQEELKEKRVRDFTGFQVTTEMLNAASKDVRFMHCLPARRGQEVSDDVMNDPRSIVFEQAENRMHLAKGLIVWLLQHAGN